MTPHFSFDELKCNCGCEQANMDPAFLAKLERVRMAFRQPVIITSGYRCENHPDYKPNSAHSIGMAVDVAVEGADALRLVDRAIYCGMKGIGVNQKGEERFIHIDSAPMTPSRPRPWIWSY